MTENLWVVAAIVGSLLILAAVLTGGDWYDRRTRKRDE